MTIETKILIEKHKPTPLAKIKSTDRVALKIIVEGREVGELPGNLTSIQLEFFNSGNAKEYLGFSRPNSFPVILLPDETGFGLDYDFCSIKAYVGDILDKESVFLHFSPPISL